MAVGRIKDMMTLKMTNRKIGRVFSKGLLLCMPCIQMYNHTFVSVTLHILSIIILSLLQFSRSIESWYPCGRKTHYRQSRSCLWGANDRGRGFASFVLH